MLYLLMIVLGNTIACTFAEIYLSKRAAMVVALLGGIVIGLAAGIKL